MSTLSLFNIHRLNLLIGINLSDFNQNIHKDPLVSSMDIEALVRMETSFYRLRSLTNDYTEKYLDFLDVIASNNPSLKTVERLNSKLRRIRKEADHIFNESLHNNPRSMILYSNFIAIFQFRNKQAGTIRKRIEILEERLKLFKQEDKLFYDLNLMFTEKSSIIQLGAGLDNLGKILKVNIGASLLSKYGMQELMTFNVNRLITTSIAMHHQGYLMRAYKKGEFSIMYKEQRNFLIDKAGFAIPISLLIKPMYEITNHNFQYISYLQPLQTGSAYILTSGDGVIEAFSESAAKMLNISPKNVVESGLYIQSLIPQFIEFFVEKKHWCQSHSYNVEKFLVDSSSLKGMPRNMNQEIKSRMFCYKNMRAVSQFLPYVADSTGSVKLKPKKPLSFGLNRQMTIAESRQLKRIVLNNKSSMFESEDVKREYNKWRKDNGMKQGQAYNVDIVLRLIVTADTHIFVFQLKNSQILANDIDEAVDAIVRPTGSKRNFERGGTQKMADLKDRTKHLLGTQESRMSDAKSNGEPVDAEDKLKYAIANIFNQQNFFDDVDNKAKRYEIDKSESVKSDDASDDEEDHIPRTDMRSDSLSASSIARSSMGAARSNSQYSAGESLRQGGEEENLMTLSATNFVPPCFTRFKVVFLMLAAVSIIATIIVLAYDSIFNSKLINSINQIHKLNRAESIVVENAILVQILSLSKVRFNNVNSNLSQQIISTLKSNVNTLSSYKFGLDFSIENNFASEGQISLYTSARLKYKYSSFTDPLTISLIELYKIHSTNIIRLNDNSDLNGDQDFDDLAYSVYSNANSVFEAMIATLDASWLPALRSYSFALVMVLCSSVLLALVFSVWLQMQVSKCYDYLNEIYGMMVSFTPSLIKTHRTFVYDLSNLLESKLDDKKLRRKAKRSIVKSEENKRHDLGLKSQVKSVSKIPKPTLRLILIMISLLLFVGGYTAFLLYNMGIFSQVSQKALKLFESLMEIHVSMHVAGYNMLNSIFNEELLGYTLDEEVIAYYLKHIKPIPTNLDEEMYVLSQSSDTFERLMEYFVKPLPACKTNWSCNRDTQLMLHYGLSRGLATISRGVTSVAIEGVDTVNAALSEYVVTYLMKHFLISGAMADFNVRAKEAIIERFSSVAAGSLYINLVLIACLGLAYGFAWLFFGRTFQSRMLLSKNMLTLLPTTILSQNLRVGKFLQEIFHLMNKNK